MKKNLKRRASDIHVNGCQHFGETSQGEMLYDVSFKGNVVINDMTRQEAEDMVECLQKALGVDWKGGHHG